MFKKAAGDWTRLRDQLDSFIECDFHHGRRTADISYWYAMSEVHNDAISALKQAQTHNYRYVLFRHGNSTSRPGQTTARSVVRGLMRSPESTQYVIKAQSIQHETVFVAAIKPAARDNTTGGG